MLLSDTIIRRARRAAKRSEGSILSGLDNTSMLLPSISVTLVRSPNELDRSPP
jgi:hypothetical protein